MILLDNAHVDVRVFSAQDWPPLTTIPHLRNDKVHSVKAHEKA